MAEGNDSVSVDWNEPWLERPITVPAHASLSVGRLLNCFRFHALQAWLLYYPGQEEMWESQYHCSFRVLDKMVEISHDVDSPAPDNLRNVIYKLKHDWNTAFHHPQHERTLDETMRYYAEREGECSFATTILNAVAFVDDRLLPSLRKGLSDSLGERDRSYFCLGECLDQGVRPPYVSRKLLPHGVECVDEIDRQLDSGQQLDDWRTGEPRGPYLPPNSLARYSRTPGEFRPDSAWWGDLAGFLSEAGIRIKVPDKLSQALSEATRVGILEIVDKLDQEIRHALNPGPPEIAVIRATHSVEVGDRSCIFRSETDEFRFIELLIDRLGAPVPYLDIAKVAIELDESDLREVKAETKKACDVIRRLKRRVCEKLEQFKMSDVAAAIKSAQKAYILSWPPSSQ